MKFFLILWLMNFIMNCSVMLSRKGFSPFVATISMFFRNYCTFVRKWLGPFFMGFYFC